MSAPEILSDLWQAATNAVCQTMQERRMCKCPSGQCLAAEVEITHQDMEHGLAQLRSLAASQPAPAADTGQAVALDADRAVSVELMQRVWANLYFDEEGAEFTFQSTLNDVVDWLTKNNAVPPLVETEKGLRCPSIPAPNSDEHVAVALDKLRAALRQKEGEA